jgi:hypothetical protein
MQPCSLHLESTDANVLLLVAAVHRELLIAEKFRELLERVSE